MSNLHPIIEEAIMPHLGDRRKYTGELISNAIQAARLDLDDYLLILDAFIGRVKGREIDDHELEFTLRSLHAAYSEMEVAATAIEVRNYEPEPYRPEEE